MKIEGIKLLSYLTLPECIMYNYSMPIYEYKCEKCNKIFEIFQKVNDKPLKKCDCGSKVVRIFHPPGIVFKGSGFYSTDNRKKEKQKTRKSEKPKEKKDKKPKESKKKEKKGGD